MSSELRPLSYVVLSIVGRDGASAYEIVQVAERAQRLYWAGAASKMYAEPKRLTSLGYLRAELRQGKIRERPHYTLTDRGLTALQEWLARPSAFPRIQSEVAIRIFASGLARDDAVITSLRALRADIEELRAEIDVRDELPPAFPGRQEEVALMRSLARRLLQAHLDWIEEAEPALAEWRKPNRRAQRS